MQPLNVFVVLLVWTPDYDRTADIHAIYANESEAVDFIKNADMSEHVDYWRSKDDGYFTIREYPVINAFLA